MQNIYSRLISFHFHVYYCIPSFTFFLFVIFNFNYSFFFIAFNYSDTIKNFAYFKKRLEYSENSIYKNYYKNYKLSKLIKYKFISKIVTSLPIALGLDKENIDEYIKI